jgi:hypothetical protein
MLLATLAWLFWPSVTQVSQIAEPQDARSSNDPTSFLRNHLIFGG